MLRVRRRTAAWWPWRRTLAFTGGSAAAVAAVAGPLAEAAELSFPAHMVAHLLLGMLAPLLLVAAAPVTVALRALPVGPARLLSRVLRFSVVRWATHPVPVALGNAAGLWAYYGTPLFALAETHPLVHVLVHLHVIVLGYLVIASVVVVDPNPHPAGLGVRAGALLFTMAAHSILAKHVYASPPPGIDMAQAEVAGMVMYYGGDLLEVVAVVWLCSRWYARTSPDRRRLRVTGAVG